jgi:hypothetical protein
MADTDDELHAMAALIGVARKWHQGSHYDICLSKRAFAVDHVARDVGLRLAPPRVSETCDQVLY